MKKHILIGSTLLVAASAAFSAIGDHKGHEHGEKNVKHAHEVKPSYGGVVSVVKDVNYELVVKPDSIALYVTDRGKTVDLAGASAKLTLLSASERLDVTLVSAGDRLEAKGSFKLGSGVKAAAQVTFRDKSAVAVRFSLK
jgi:hypothetical protein